MYTSGFVDDVLIANNGQEQAMRKGAYSKIGYILAF